jgi:uncharacterized damage-inducible protein DinB
MTETSLLADKLKQEGEKIVKYFEGLRDDQWSIEIYTEDTVWTIRNILAHLVTSERAFVKLFDNIRQGGVGVTDDFVIDRYNARQQEKTKELGVQELLKRFKSLREEMVVWVLNIADSDLEKTGRHPFLGQTTLREMIKMVYLHNQIHIRDIKNGINHQNDSSQPYKSLSN